MEFLLVGESKLKIMLTDAEMKEYSLDPPPEDSGGAGFRRAFYKIIDRAKREVGFDPMGDKILIQFYPMKAGGCEVFVTKLGILPESARRLVSRSDKVTMLERCRSFYAFAGFDELSRCCAAIKSICSGYSPHSDVYYHDGRYYLSIEEYGKGGEPMEFPCILEFSSQLTADFSYYLTEHAQLLCEGDGVEKFSSLS